MPGAKWGRKLKYGESPFVELDNERMPNYAKCENTRKLSEAVLSSNESRSSSD